MHVKVVDFLGFRVELLLFECTHTRLKLCAIFQVDGETLEPLLDYL